MDERTHTRPCTARVQALEFISAWIQEREGGVIMCGALSKADPHN